MTTDKQKGIASSFSDLYETFDLNLALCQDEFAIFSKGIFADDMDSKWNIFVLGNLMFWARSWTGYCIYKIEIEQNSNFTILSKVSVTRNKKEYRITDVKRDKVILLKLIQAILKREDLYIDPEFQLELVKKTIEQVDPHNIYKKSIGHNTVGITKQVYSGQKSITGWEHLLKNISKKSDSEPLLSLYMQHRHEKSATTFYFDEKGTMLLGQITIV